VELARFEPVVPGEIAAAPLKNEQCALLHGLLLLPIVPQSRPRPGRSPAAAVASAMSRATPAQEQAKLVSVDLADGSLPAGTLLQCTLDEPNFSSRSAQIGDPILCHVGALVAFGHSVFPRGAYLAGHFQEYRDPGRQCSEHTHLPRSDEERIRRQKVRLDRSPTGLLVGHHLLPSAGRIHALGLYEKALNYMLNYMRNHVARGTRIQPDRNGSETTTD
jgi:hypothetical protein